MLGNLSLIFTSIQQPPTSMGHCEVKMESGFPALGFKDFQLAALPTGSVVHAERSVK